MLDQEDMPVRRGFRGSRVFVATLDRKGIQVVKAPKEISGLKVRQDQRVQLALLVRREISGFRAQEVFQDQREQRVQPALWDHKA